MDMKRPNSNNIETLEPRKRAKIDIPNTDLEAIKPRLDKKAKMAGKFARDYPDDVDDEIAIFLLHLVEALTRTSLKDEFIPSLFLSEAREIVKSLDKEEAVENLACGRWQAFLDLPSLHIVSQLSPPKSPNQPDHGKVTRAPPPDPLFVAIADAWRLQYQGKSHRLIWDYICGPGQDLYALYCAIIQSSGMGASRMIDELAKEQFVIPINIRRDKFGWPPEDKGVRNFLIQEPEYESGLPHGEEDPPESYQRFEAFFIALFVEIALVLNGERQEKVKDQGDFLFASRVDMCRWFQAYMAPEAKSLNHNARRRALYRRVVRRATYVLNNLTIIHTDPITGTTQPPRETRASAAARVGEMSPNRIKVDTAIADLLAPLVDPVANHDDATKIVNITDLSERFVSFLRGLYPPHMGKPPVEVMCAFDGADMLSFEKMDIRQNEPPTFRHAIRELARSIFTVFLSANTRVSRLRPPALDPPGSRIYTPDFTIPAPFVALPFDILVEKITNQGIALDKAVTFEYMAQFGRPKWASLIQAAVLEGRDCSSDLVPLAALKLLREPINTPRKLSDSESLAVFSTLLALDYRSETVRDREEEERQVAQHMRVCQHISSDFYTIVTASPSEPILAEGALLCLRRTNVRLGKMLNEVLGQSLVAAGERGEHVAAFLCLKASLDARKYRITAKLRLLDFLKSLLCADVSKVKPSVSSDSLLPLGKAFESAYVYFNHVIKLGTQEVAKASVLWATMARGGLIVLANGHKGADLLVPVCIGDQVTPDSVTFGIIRINRDGAIKFNDAGALISAMDPYSIGLYPSGHQLKHPIIRLVMSFYSEAGTASIPASAIVSSEVDSYTSSNDPMVSKPKATYTSYDIWCGGISDKVYACIYEDEARDYLAALHTCTPLSKIFSNNMSEERQTVHRTQLPAFSLEKGHWCWTNFSEEGTLG